MFRIIAAFLVSTGLLFSLDVHADSLSEARALFTKYANLEAAFDANIADLYTDDALIKNKRKYPTGQVREIVIPAPQYKQLIRSAMPLAKAMGDFSTYSEIRVEKEGNAVRISAKRFSVRKKYFSPISLLAIPSVSGAWFIREEISESQP